MAYATFTIPVQTGLMFVLQPRPDIDHGSIQQLAAVDKTFSIPASDGGAPHTLPADGVELFTCRKETGRQTLTALRVAKPVKVKRAGASTVDLAPGFYFAVYTSGNNPVWP